MLEPWCFWVVGLGMGPLAPEVTLLNFIHHTWVWDYHPAASLHAIPAALSSPPLATSMPSYLSGWVWLLLILGCRTSIQLNFLMVLGDTSFVIFSVVVQGGKVCLPMPLSWPEVSGPSYFLPQIISLMKAIKSIMNSVKYSSCNNCLSLWFIQMRIRTWY